MHKQYYTKIHEYDYESITETVVTKLINIDLQSYSHNIRCEVLDEMGRFNGTIHESIEEEANPYIVFMGRYNTSLSRAFEVLSILINKTCIFYESIDKLTSNFLSAENKDLIDNNTSDIYFPQEYYRYANLRSPMIQSNILLKLNKVISDIRTNMENINETEVFFYDTDNEFVFSTRKTIINKLMEYYDMKDKVPAGNISADELRNRYAKLIPSTKYGEENDIVSEYWLIDNSYGKDISDFRNMIRDVNKIIQSSGIDRYKDSPKLRRVLEEASNKIDKIMELYVLDFTVRLEAIMGYITTNNAIISEAIGQMSNTYSTYIVPNDINDQINDSIDWQEDLQEVQEMLIYNSTVLHLESAGLITIQEETRDQVAAYFNKIMMGMQRVIEKIQTTIRKKLAEQINPILAKLKSPDKPDPTFNIKNAKSFDFTKLNAIQPEPFQYEVMKESLKNREDFINRYYPTLKPREKEKSMYKIMLDQCMTQVASVTCTSRLINDYVDFLTKGYIEQLESLPDFQKAIEDASKQASGIAQTIDQNVNKEVQNVQAVQQQQNAQQVTQSTTGESANIVTEADRTKFEDTAKAQNKGQGDTNLMRASTLYCTIMSNLLSSRIKVLNFAYNDRLRIVMHYAVKNGFTKKENKEQQ